MQNGTADSSSALYKKQNKKTHKNGVYRMLGKNLTGIAFIHADYFCLVMNSAYRRNVFHNHRITEVPHHQDAHRFRHAHTCLPGCIENVTLLILLRMQNDHNTSEIWGVGCRGNKSKVSGHQLSFMQRFQRQFQVLQSSSLSEVHSYPAG